MRLRLGFGSSAVWRSDPSFVTRLRRRAVRTKRTESGAPEDAPREPDSDPAQVILKQWDEGLGQRADEEPADDDQRRGGRLRRDHSDQRCDVEEREEQRARDDARPAGAAAGTNAGASVAKAPKLNSPRSEKSGFETMSLGQTAPAVKPAS